MSWSLLAAIVLASGVLLVLLSFLLGREEPWDLDETPGRFQAIRKSYEKTLRILKDLEFDLQVGTLSPEEHGPIRAEYMRKAVSLKKALEGARRAALRGIASGRSASLSEEERQAIEGLVARARSRKQQP